VTVTTTALRAPRRAEQRSARRRASGLARAKARAGWILLAPALVHSIVFMAIPTIIVVVLSFTDARVVGRGEFVWLENYVTLFQDQTFRTALLNTLAYTIVVVPIGMAIALLIALGLNAPIRGKGAYRTLFYVPVVTSAVAVSTVWLWIYNPSSGLANEVLAFFGIGRSGWLTNPDVALPALMVIGVWQGLGSKMIIYLAALQSVSQELVEAARLDGANRWQVFWNVTWPALGPVQFFVLVTSIAGSFQVFDLVYVMTQGGPANATNVLTFDIFTNAFARLQIGYASAETVIMFVFVGVMIYLGRLTQRDRKEN
jgi:multiple sugar transport system permease protein